MSDHCMVLCKLTDKKPYLLTKVRYRKIKFIDIESLKKYIQLTTLCLEPPEAIDDLMTCYETTLSDVLDKHAPLIIKTITVRPCVPWFSDEIKTAKQLRRKRERVWRRTRLSSDKEIIICQSC